MMTDNTEHPQIPLNTMLLQLTLRDDGDMNVFMGHNLSEDIPDDEAQFYMDFFQGLNISLTTAIQQFAMIGYLSRSVSELQDELDGEEIGFEPDEELLQAIADAKVIPMNKKKMN